MSDELKDILANLNKDIEQEKLLEYLQQKLNATDAHELEKQMADDAFMNDAAEGLESVKDKRNLALYAEQLNRELKKQIEKKKSRKEKRKIKDQPWLYFSIVLILLLIIIGYIIIKKYLAG